MSNTSTVSPYVSTSSDTGTEVAGAIAGAAAIGVIISVAALAASARWLAEETVADVAAVQAARTDRRRERLMRSDGAAVKAPAADGLSIMTVELHLREPASLIRSAERLGYHVEPSLGGSREAPVLLRSARGERIAIGRSQDGRIVLETAGDRERIRSLVHRHSTDRVVEHLRSRGMDVRTARLANGELQVMAQERQTGQPGGAAEIRAQIQNDGTAWLDIDKVRGGRCEQIVAEVAEAIGGEVCRSTRKDSFYQLPGEPTKTSVKV